MMGLFLLNNLANKFDKNSVGLYRDEGFALFKNINGHRTNKIHKEFHQLLKKKGTGTLALTNHIANLMMKHFRSTLKPITQPIFLNNYIYQLKLDYLTFPAILKFFMKHLNTPNNENENKSESSKNRKRNIICFKPPFSRNISNNIGKHFLLLIQKHFSSNH